ncbi:MAG: hypothetical protein ACPL7E_06040, partial [bacterium]
MNLSTWKILFFPVYFLILLGQMGIANSDNILVNGGFELTRNGVPVGWSIPQDIASLDSTSPHSGKFCLRYTREDKNDYRLVSQQIPCIPGKLYSAKVWVKGKDIKDGDPWDQG